MKKTLLSFALLAGIHLTARAQAPAGFNYQGIARDAAGAPLAAASLGLRITIHNAFPNGNVVYQETHTATTNAYGLYNLIIGNGIAITGTLEAVNWAAGDKYLQVELDPAGGTAYTDLGTSRLVSVPYALHAGSAPAPLLTLSGNALSAGGNTVNLPSAAVYTGGTGITVSGGNVISVNSLSGDVNGAPNANTVTRIQGTVVSATAPATDQVLKYNGTSWTPAADADLDAQTLSLSGNTLSLTNGGAVTLPTAPVYTGGTGITIAGTVISAGDLAGDVSGAPNATTVTKIQGNAVSTATPATGQVLKYNGTAYAPSADADAQTLSISGTTLSLSNGGSVALPAAPVYTGGTGVTVSGTVINVNNLGGDVSGAPNATTVAKIQGTPVSSAVPVSGQVLKYNGTSYVPATDADAQALSLSGNTLSLSNGGSVTLPLPASGTVSGTVNYVPKFTAANTIGNSQIVENGGKVGIGITTPAARLEVADGSVLFSASDDVPSSAGPVPASGVGRRMMWYADKAAFRAGFVNAGQWDEPGIGNYSFASGFNTLASGNAASALGYQNAATQEGATAMGYISLASGQYSTAIGNHAAAIQNGATALGYYTTAAGVSSTAMGDNTTASGDYATSMGKGTTASGSHSTAMGYNTNASGNYSTASGYNTYAEGLSSIAMGMNAIAEGYVSTAMGRDARAYGIHSNAIGSYTTANGDYSTAMGNYVSTNNNMGAFILGDQSVNLLANTTNSSASNQMTMRFIGGYRLFANSGLTTGLSILPGSGRVGIGTFAPAARLHVADSSVLFSASGDASPFSAVPAPVDGAGRRMMWYSDKAAFRTGYVDGDQWDAANTGIYSFASGYSTKASGIFGTAMGQKTTASGLSSTAMGAATTATGNYSTAMGQFANASGLSSTAMGQESVASGNFSTASGILAMASGQASTAMGSSTVASGGYSTAMGLESVASGQYATATGYRTTASGNFSTATGVTTTASGLYSTAMGAGTTASSNASTAMGFYTIASNGSSTAMGNNTTASGSISTAMGWNTTASGDYSTTMGNYVNTNGKTGSFAIGDANNNNPAYGTMSSDANNQMSMRFAGGYRLFSNDALTSGVILNGGSGSWSNVSDRRKKQNFHALDPEEVLQKVAALPVTNWNYKSQDSSVRHIGPMAQDFYAAFGLDGIGADTTINTTDIDGVNMAAIQALEARTKALQQTNDAQQRRIAQLEAQNSRASASLSTTLQDNARLQTQLRSMDERLRALEDLANRQPAAAPTAAHR